MALLGDFLAGHRLDVDQAGPGLDLPGQEREVLAQGVALELGRQVEVAHPGVAVEADAEHLPALPLVPVGAGIDRDPGRRPAASSSSTSTLRVTPWWRVVDDTRAKTWKRPSEPATPKVISVGWTGALVSPPASSPPILGAGIQSMPETNER